MFKRVAELLDFSPANWPRILVFCAMFLVGVLWADLIKNDPQPPQKAYRWGDKPRRGPDYIKVISEHFPSFLLISILLFYAISDVLHGG